MPLESAVEPKFFLDHNLAGRTIYNALRNAGVQVERLADIIHCTSDDRGWIPLISSPPFEWVIVTRDNAILWNVPEFAAICDSRARIVMFPGNEDLGASALAARFVERVPEIFATLRQHPGPVIIVLHRDGNQVIPESHVLD